MKRYLILMSFVLLVVLAACGGQTPATELQPTVETAGATTEAGVVEAAPTEALPVETSPIAHVADPALVNKEWLWESRDPNGGATAAITVPTPEEYNIIFNEDGTFFAQLDCNRGSGDYATPGDGSISMTLGMTTKAFCPPDSLFNQMLETFASAAGYTIQENGAVLAIAWANGGPIDTYRAADAMTTTTSTAVDTALVGKKWQWLGTTTPVEEITVADASRYTIEFLEDGSAAITADCNTVLAQVTADGTNMTITPGPSTLVACPEDSQADLFTQQLSAAAIYFFQEGDLFIDLFASSGTMHFEEVPLVDLPAPDAGEPTGTVNAPAGVFLRSGPGVNFPAIGTAAQGDSGTLIGISQDRNWFVVEAPSMPDGRVWVAAAFVDAVGAENLPTVQAPALPSTLVGPVWQWSGTAGTQATTVADPTRYTITFAANGTASIKADCNMVTATYTLTGAGLSLVPGASTMAMCPPDSQGQQFVQQLALATVHTVQGSELMLNLTDGSTMRLVSGPVSSTPDSGGTTGGATGGASGLTFRVVSFGPVGAEQPVIAGSQITATFDETALSVSGSGGCNSYSASITPQSGAFTVGPVASTLMACESPAGVMQQETAFLAALQGVNAYRWTQQVINQNNVITSGQLNYSLADGTAGVINLVTP